MNTNTFVRPSFDGKIFTGVEVNVGGEHFLIAPHDLSDKERDWKDTMKLLEQTNNKTFTYKQICAVMMFREEINTILKENGGEPLDKWYWTCAEYSAYYAFYYDGYDGTLYGDYGDYTFSCRAVLALETLPLNETDRLSELEKQVVGLTKDMNTIKTFSNNYEND